MTIQLQAFLRSLSFVWWRHSVQGRLVPAVGDSATRESSLTRCICIFVFVFAGCADIASHWRVGDFGGRISLLMFSFSRDRFKCIPRFSRVLQAGLWVFEEAVCTITNWDPTQMQTRLLEVCIIMELCRIMLKLFLRRCFRRRIREEQAWMLDFITIASWISSHLFHGTILRWTVHCARGFDMSYKHFKKKLTDHAVKLFSP